MTSITIPASVTSIGADAFKGCTSLTSVTIEGNPTIADGAFPSGVTVNLPPATAPTITTQPTDLNLTEGYESNNVLTVAASTVEGQTLSYQWFSNTTNSTSGGTAIDDATSADYTVPAGKTAGLYYYYCVVTATMSPNGQTATATSDVATITIESAEPPAPTAYSITTDGNCEVYNADYWSENIPLTEAPEGMELVIRLKDEAQPESGKYFTEEFSVNGVSLGRESEWVFKSDFTMPAEAVTVAALQADKMVLTFDFTTGGSQKMDDTAVILFNNDESVSGRYDADDYTLFDLNGGGIYDMKMYWGTDGNCYVEPLSNADATGSYSFNYDEPTKCYGTITFVFPEAPTAVDVTLADAADNASTLSSHNGELANVTLSGRTFDKSGSWNTLCLPFDVTTLTGTPLEGATIKELDTGETALDTTTGELTLKFTAVSSIEAGRPYIVKWSGSGSLSNPVFEGVTISSTSPTEVVSTDGNVKFVGQYAPFAIDADNLNVILFVGSGNQIGYSKNARTLNCFRAHFWVKPNGSAQATRTISIDFGDSETTSIRLVDADGTSAATGIYTLDGRRLQAEPT